MCFPAWVRDGALGKAALEAVLPSWKMEHRGLRCVRRLHAFARMLHPPGSEQNLLGSGRVLHMLPGDTGTRKRIPLLLLG